MRTYRSAGSIQHPNPNPPQHCHRHHRQGKDCKALELLWVHLPHFARSAFKQPTCPAATGIDNPEVVRPLAPATPIRPPSKVRKGFALNFRAPVLTKLLVATPLMGY
jgi:hypothetical protein